MFYFPAFSSLILLVFDLEYPYFSSLNLFLLPFYYFHTLSLSIRLIHLLLFAVGCILSICSLSNISCLHSILCWQCSILCTSSCCFLRSVLPFSFFPFYSRWVSRLLNAVIYSSHLDLPFGFCRKVTLAFLLLSNLVTSLFLTSYSFLLALLTSFVILLLLFLLFLSFIYHSLPILLSCFPFRAFSCLLPSITPLLGGISPFSSISLHRILSILSLSYYFLFFDFLY